ncbi:hypothetical protein ACSDQ9_05875 [Aestuariimicrobium soli]|uniref:hypothetical protein n=1 Tax=Aestuariimicrobium soli TaxID=2035834 RepID=UPI003EBBF055
MSDEQQFDPLAAIEDAQRAEEIDGDEDLRLPNLSSRADPLEREAPHESEDLEEPVLTANGQVVPVPEHESADSE